MFDIFKQRAKFIDFCAAATKDIYIAHKADEIFSDLLIKGYHWIINTELELLEKCAKEFKNKDFEVKIKKLDGFMVGCGDPINISA